jgi:hypothetical protein
MGGLGSTRWADYKPRRMVGECLALRPPTSERIAASGRYIWPELGAEVPFSLHRSFAGSVLNLSVGAESQAIALDETFLSSGGARLWFKCPECKSRVGRLYTSGRSPRFRCRACCQLVYESSRLHRSVIEKMLRKAAKGRGLRLGQVLEEFRVMYGGRPDRRMVAQIQGG